MKAAQAVLIAAGLFLAASLKNVPVYCACYRTPVELALRLVADGSLGGAAGIAAQQTAVSRPFDLDGDGRQELIGKKDLGAMAMTYGYVYVAQIGMGAEMNQALKAITEAEAYIRLLPLKRRPGTLKTK